MSDTVWWQRDTHWRLHKGVRCCKRYGEQLMNRQKSRVATPSKHSSSQSLLVRCCMWDRWSHGRGLYDETWLKFSNSTGQGAHGSWPLECHRRAADQNYNMVTCLSVCNLCSATAWKCLNLKALLSSACLTNVGPRGTTTVAQWLLNSSNKDMTCCWSNGIALCRMTSLWTDCTDLCWAFQCHG